MSAAHKEEFERIKRENRIVIDLLRFAAEKSRQGKIGRHPILSGIPSVDPMVIEAAIDTANDAYALLLIATAERFLRGYLNVPLNERPDLNALIHKCRKEFNKTGPEKPIRPDSVRDINDLREKRNLYAHGRASSVFPSIGRVAEVLGRFFDSLP